METCVKCKYCLYAKAPYNNFVCHNQKSKSFGKVLKGRAEACEDFDRLNGTKMSIVEASELSLKSKGSFYFYKLPKYEGMKDVMMAMRFENNEDLIDFKEALLRLNLIYFDNNKDEKGKMINLEGGKWLYRLEAVDPNNGLWYDSNNKMVFGIGKLEDCETKNLPMGYDVRYHKDGKDWFSSCSNIENLSHWYSYKNALDLIADGFVFTRYYAIDYVEYEYETTFLKETALCREVIPIEEVFEKEKHDTETEQTIPISNVYYRVHKNSWNKQLTYEENNANGCNLPPENVPVIIYDAEKHNYFIGRISSNNHGELVLSDSSGHIRIDLNDYTYWSSFGFAEYIE